MQPTLEEKAKFFALYYGQQIVQWREDIPPNNPVFVNKKVFDTMSDHWFLDLKDLKDISDEDAKEVANMLKCKYCKLDVKEVKDHLMSILDINYNNVSGFIIFRTLQYLQSKGYALPWMMYSIDQMIEFGWIRLIEK